LSRVVRAARIVVQQNEGDVVPVLGFPARPCSRALGEQEPGERGHIHFSDVFDAADSGPGLTDLDIARGEPGAAKIHGTELIAAIKLRRRLSGHIAEVSQHFELHDCTWGGTGGGPPPDSLAVWFELGVA